MKKNLFTPINLKPSDIYHSVISRTTEDSSRLDMAQAWQDDMPLQVAS